MPSGSPQLADHTDLLFQKRLILQKICGSVRSLLRTVTVTALRVASLHNAAMSELRNESDDQHRLLLAALTAFDSRRPSSHPPLSARLDSAARTLIADREARYVP